MAPPKLKGLGRGLDALLAGNSRDDARGELQTLSVDELQPIAVPFMKHLMSPEFQLAATVQTSQSAEKEIAKGQTQRIRVDQIRTVLPRHVGTPTGDPAALASQITGGLDNADWNTRREIIRTAMASTGCSGTLSASATPVAIATQNVSREANKWLICRGLANEAAPASLHINLVTLAVFS